MSDCIVIKSGYDQFPAWEAAFSSVGIQALRWEHRATCLESIRYALVWHPEPGELAKLPALELVFSIGAGVDHLVGDSLVPGGLPVVRNVDPGLTAGMVEQGYGRVVYTSSTAGQVAEYASAAYNSSKHGLLGLMRSVAQDGGVHGITSNAVLPGWVKTEMADNSAIEEAKQRGISPEAVWSERAELYPPKRVVTPQEVAEVIAFLASEESSGVSGEAITVALGGVW